ncbi:nitrate reductase molybdenum cofactor assembly chaperone [Pusillimonas sp. ANT_WB101]|uniref:nitrate reductase molybdenum cofactor assembly chaperone n=1 Tax=Pusillimonas sp. ANT_WB101 TaxID=2597356 RepID=UPI0011EBB1AC|nr:nitrate reductase molybdenum cofactor assembly chaperone [Pusillimonas sp. ANT_WB101]KAA0911198.1 nitrate reductase molybdenum cofactor assembly chaperone [Pusillimonas sp. ANT_WB101]
MKNHGPLLQALGALLDYPDQTLLDALPEIRDIVTGHSALPAASRAALSDLIDHLDGIDLIAMQEAYVEIFDRGRANSLYLFEHVHGESRERGQAMVDLLAMYEKSGLFLHGRELPDYLPVFLEFVAREAPQKARALLEEIAEINRTIATHLAQRGIPHYAAVAALLPLAGAKPLDPDEISPVEDEQAAIDTEALDKEWQDEPVSFLNAPAPLSNEYQPVQFYEKRPPR